MEHFDRFQEDFLFRLVSDESGYNSAPAPRMKIGYKTGSYEEK